MISTISPPTSYLERQWQKPDYPLLRERTHFTIRERWLQKYADFAPLALDTANADFSTAYLVDEEVIDRLENVLRYERLWSTVPDSWVEYQSVGFDYPGFLGTFGSPGSLVSSGVTAAPDATSKLIVITKTSHGLTTSNYLQVFFTLQLGSNIIAKLATYLKVVAATTNTFTLPYYCRGSTITSVSYQTVAGSPTRALRSITANARVLHEYALPGVTAGITTAADFQPAPDLQFLDSTGSPVTELIGSTRPTNAEWIDAALAGSYFVRDSRVETYLGNILERVSTMLPYRL